MLQIEFKGPQQKSYIVPQSKQAQKEKEYKRREKQLAAKTIRLMKEQKKMEKLNDPSKKVQDPEMKIIRQFMNLMDPKEYTNKEAPAQISQQKDDLSFTEQPEIIKKTDFLNTAEYQEIKDRYSDYNMGEFVMKFPNPDYEHLQDRPVTIFEAEKLFDDQLCVIAEGGIPQSILKQQKKAFICSFLQLDDYVERDPTKLKAMEEEQKRKQKQNEKKKFGSALANAIVGQIIGGHKQTKEKINKDMLKYQVYMEKFGRKKKENLVTIVNDQHERQPLKDGVPQIEQNGLVNERPANQDIPQNIPDINNIFQSNQNPQFNNPEIEAENEGDAIDNQLNMLLNLRLTKSKNYEKVQKTYCKGGFLYKRMTEDKTDYDWVQVGTVPQDLLTLIRQTIIVKLTRDAHFHCRQFISSDDQYIFLTIKSNYNAIRKVAAQQRIWKQYELGYADILSLEPCDERLRPLRLKQYVTDPDFRTKYLDYLPDNLEDKKAKLSRIENDAQKLYQDCKKWGDQELRAYCVLNQIKLDPLIKLMAKELHISLNHEKVTIADDPPQNRLVWEAFYIHQLYLIDYLQRVFDADKFKEVKKNRGFLFKLIFRKAMGDPNELYWKFHSSLFRSKLILLNLWDRQQIPAVAPYGQYFTTSENESLWRQYEVNEKGLRSEFMNVEKLQIANTILFQHLNVKRLIEYEYMHSYFAIHDPYQLLGMAKAAFMKPLIDLQMISEIKQTAGQQKLNDLFISLKDEAEGADFDGDSLAEEAGFHWCPIWQLPIDVMRDYFGDKIALYFRFLQFYTEKLWTVVVISIICEGIIDTTSGDAKNAFVIIFAIIIIMWSSYFIAHWKRQQIMFQIQFGLQHQTDAGQMERPAFEGNFIRSIVTDKLNEEIQPSWKKQYHLAKSAIITLIIICSVVASVIGVFFLKSYLIDNYEEAFINSFIPSILNAIIIQIFNMIYFNVSNRLNNAENHKYEAEYENSLIIKTFCFTFVNTFNSLAIIAFLNEQFPNLQLCLTNTGLDCYKALQAQMITIFMVNFAKVLPQLIVPCIKSFLRSESKTVDDNPVVHEFNAIDEFIENQGDLEPYQSNAEVDGLMNDYMELIIQFAFLQLFGLAFPIAYLIAFITNVTQIQVDKMKLIHFMQRPIPTGAATIGNWLIILEIISFISVFCNAGLVVFTSKSIPTGQAASFSIFVLTFLGLKYFSTFVISPFPEKARLIVARHKFAMERVHRGMVSSNKSYLPGMLKPYIDVVDYGNMISHMTKQHILKAPNVAIQTNEQHK